MTEESLVLKASERNRGQSTGFTWRQQIEFIRKELRETLRDRRTIITLLAMPILLYPLLGLGFRFLAMRQLSASDSKIYIGLEDERAAQWAATILKQGASLVEAAREKSQDAALETVNEKAKGKGREPQLSDADRELILSLPKDAQKSDLLKLVSEGVIDIGLKIKQSDPRRPPGVANPSQVELIYDKATVRGETAARVLSERLEAVNQDLLKRWAQSEGIEFSMPIQQQQIRAKSTDRGTSILGLLPLVLLLMTVTGGVYPAIDLTAGERERNTLETLMALPVPKIRLLIAKFVAVVSVTMLTGLMNLLAMSITLYALQLDTVLLGEKGFSIGLAGKLFLILSAFAMFYSAVLLLICSSARSFKEAQAYVIPLLLLSIGPGLVILLPGWSLGQGTAVLPLVNVLLLSKEVLEGIAKPLPAIVAILTTMFYGLAALALAAQIFGADAVAVGSRSRWRDLFQRPVESRPFPSLALVLVGLALLFPAYFVASGILARGAEVSPSYRLGLSGILTAILFLGFPILLIRLQNIQFRSGLGLNATRPLIVIGGLLIGLSTWPFVYEIVLLSQQIGMGWLDLSRFEQVKELLAAWSSIPLPVVLLAMAVAPGVCEELFFRGFFYGGVRQHFKPIATILITAIAFALFHVVMAGGAAPERILPSGLMGLLLGWVRHRSGSVIPGILLHVVHNAALLTIAHYREELEGWGVGALHQVHLPVTGLAIAALILIVGIALVMVSKKK
jgi:ABC-2 type transport system permease protein/sodium transport system permease protein